MQNGPGRIAIAWAEKPFSLPSLKWTAMVTPRLDVLAAPEVRHAEGVRAVEAADTVVVDIEVADEQQAVRAHGDRRVPADAQTTSPQWTTTRSTLALSR
jgi:hypothetical protein